MSFLHSFRPPTVPRLFGVLVVTGAASVAGCASILGADFDALQPAEDAASSPPESPVPNADAATPTDGVAPLPVTADGCAPTCAGKACGAPDGCGGTCQTGSCAAGLQCNAGACACTLQSCAGCCQNNECMEGRLKATCGSGGKACSPCAAAEICYQRTCTPAVTGCYDFSDPPMSNLTCSKVCQAYGKTCTPGCFTDPTAAGRYTDAIKCGGLLSTNIATCNTTISFNANDVAALCCCI